MIRLLIILLLAVGMTPSVEALKNVPPKTLQPSKIEQELLQAERAVIDASVGRDSKALQRLLSEDYMLITEDGEILNQAQAIAGLNDPDLVFENFQTEDVKVRVYGNTAIVTGRYTQKGQQKGVAFSTPYRYTDVYVKKGRAWQLVSAHGSRIKQ
jgi:ketosteroid isomerase-like protein